MYKLFRNILITVSCLLMLTVVAFATENTAFSVVDAEGVAGETVTVPIFIDNNSGVVSISLEIKYDTSTFSLKEVIDKSLLPNAMHTTQLMSSYYLTWDNDTSTENYTQTGCLAELVFVIADNTAVGEYPITISIPRDGVLSNDGGEISCSVSSGKICVISNRCNHDWGDWKKSSNAKHKHVCSLCDEVEYETHDWDNGIITEEPTEDEVGIKVYTCEICAGTKSEIIPALSDGAEKGELTVSAAGIKVSGGASVTLELSNTGKDTESCLIAVAGFNSAGRMLDVEIANLTVNGEASLSKTLSLTTSETISKIKLFYLDDRWIPAGDVQFVSLE